MQNLEKSEKPLRQPSPTWRQPAEKILREGLIMTERNGSKNGYQSQISITVIPNLLVPRSLGEVGFRDLPPLGTVDDLGDAETRFAARRARRGILEQNRSMAAIS